MTTGAKVQVAVEVVTGFSIAASWWLETHDLDLFNFK